MSQSDKSIHGMSSKVASEAKKRGHARERERVENLLKRGILSEILGGMIKPDIKRHDGLLESIKGGKKTQWFLFGSNNVNECEYFTKEEKQIFSKYANCWTTPNPYSEHMKDVISKDPKKWVSFFMGIDKFDLMVIKDYRDGKWYEFDSEEFLDKLMNEVTEIYSTGTKVVFKGGGSHIWTNQPLRKNGVILMELDRRQSKKLSLFHSPLDRIIDCVTK
jgi:hypothetical protein